MARNWWFDDQGRNNLAGVCGDPTNPPVLPDAVIIDILINIPIAKTDFLSLLPTMLPEEQARLNELVALHPITLQPFPFNDVDIDDTFQRLQNTAGIYDPNNRRRKQW